MRFAVIYVLLLAMVGCIRSSALTREEVADDLLDNKTIQISIPPTREGRVLVIFGAKKELPDDWSANLVFKSSEKTSAIFVRKENLIEANYLQEQALKAYVVHNMGFPLLDGRTTDVELKFESPHRLEGLSLWIAFVRQ